MIPTPVLAPSPAALLMINRRHMWDLKGTYLWASSETLSLWSWLPASVGGHCRSCYSVPGAGEPVRTGGNPSGKLQANHPSAQGHIPVASLQGKPRGQGMYEGGMKASRNSGYMAKACHRPFQGAPMAGSTSQPSLQWQQFQKWRQMGKRCPKPP